MNVSARQKTAESALMRSLLIGKVLMTKLGLDQ